MTVTGPGTQWNNTGTLYVAGGYSSSADHGTLIIQKGGVVNSTDTQIGYSSGAVGTVTVTDAGSQLNTTGELVVASSGQGTLNIQNGGVVNSRVSLIGVTPGALGTATVAGPGSRFDNSDALIIGTGGQGTLTILNGGLVTDAQATVGTFGGTGNVLVDAGTWATTGLMTIGGTGSGMVMVQNGGQVTAGSIVVGSNGTLAVDPTVVTSLGDFTLLPGGLLMLDIAGTTPDLISQLDIGGFGLFQGTIDLNFIDGFAPTTGESFDLINALAADFTGATFEITGLVPGFEYTDTFANGEFTVTAENNGRSTIPEPESMWLVGSVLIALSLGVLRKRLMTKA
jgi:T5SS/PEP-CTERM-associated repeat protein